MKVKTTRIVNVNGIKYNADDYLKVDTTMGEYLKMKKFAIKTPITEIFKKHKEVK